jgi:hypothetical protein
MYFLLGSGLYHFYRASNSRSLLPPLPDYPRADLLDSLGRSLEGVVRFRPIVTVAITKIFRKITRLVADTRNKNLKDQNPLLNFAKCPTYLGLE